MAEEEKDETTETPEPAAAEETPVAEEETPAAEPVADAPDSTTPKTEHEDPTKLDQSGDPSQEKPKRGGKGGGS